MQHFIDTDPESTVADPTYIVWIIEAGRCVIIDHFATIKAALAAYPDALF